MIRLAAHFTRSRIANAQKIKYVFWDHNGFVLYYKSLAQEKFKWPKRGEELVHLNGEQIAFNPDTDIELLEEIEHAMNEIFMKS